MKKERRVPILLASLGLLVLLYLFLDPALAAWKRQSERIADLRQKIERGKQLKEREAALRERWAAMHRTDLPADNSQAIDLALQAFNRWQRGSGVTLNRLTNPQWQAENGSADLLNYSVTAAGSQEQIARFLYELESDPEIPVCLEEYTLSTRDARGYQLELTARLSFLRLKE